MYHPHTKKRFINKKIGYGIVATRPIPKGTIVSIRCAFIQVIPLSVVQTWPSIYYPLLIKYTDIDQQGNFIYYSDIEKFSNHSCDPNTICLGAAPYSITTRDIAIDEEITSDYGWTNLPMPMACSCHATICRNIIKATDVFTCNKRWHTLLIETIPYFHSVPQPLLPYIIEKNYFAMLIKNAETIPAFSELYCDEKIMEKIRQSLLYSQEAKDD